VLWTYVLGREAAAPIAGVSLFSVIRRLGIFLPGRNQNEPGGKPNTYRILLASDLSTHRDFPPSAPFPTSPSVISPFPIFLRVSAQIRGPLPLLQRE
jgi:hypothetical protein